MSLNYCLTFDYELFGSGKGCVFKHLVEPTDKILDLLEQFNVKATFFIEQLEVKAIIDRANEYPNNDAYQSEAQAISGQLKRMLKEGHDLQLHLHPQWFGAEYKNDSWVLNFDYWRFSSLPQKSSNEDFPSKTDLLIQGKQYLEALLTPISSDYECIGFRAGGYNLGFTESTYKALQDAGIAYDSSLCPGYVSNTMLSAYDYSHIKSDEVIQLTDNLIEYPLLSISSSVLEKLSLARLYSNMCNRKHKKVIGGGKSTTSEEPVITGSASANSNFDVCLSSRLQVNKFFSLTLQSKNQVAVLIGHPKDYSMFSPIKGIIKRANSLDINFVTMTEIYRNQNVH